MKIEIIDGNLIRKSSIEEVVKYLKMQDASLPKNIKDYMKIVKQRFSYINKEIDISSPLKFLKSLEEAGLIRIISKDKW